MSKITVDFSKTLSLSRLARNALNSDVFVLLICALISMLTMVYVGNANEAQSE